MKRFAWSTIMILTILLTACGSPTPSAVSPATTASVEIVNVSSPDVVIASASIVPVQVAQLGFTISALVKEIAVKEDDKVQAGQPLIVLDTSELEFAVMAAESAYQSSSINAELQDADRVKVVNKNTGRVTYVSCLMKCS